MHFVVASNNGDILFMSLNPIVVLVNYGSESCCDSLVCCVCSALALGK